MRKENRVVVATLNEMKKLINVAIKKVEVAPKSELKGIIEDTFEFSDEMERLTDRLQNFINQE